MIDLHTHTFFSDGVLIPSELVYRAKVRGYSVIALTDHADFSNIKLVTARARAVCGQLTKHYGITVIPGAEITYVPPALIKRAVTAARRAGARLVVIHGETPAETVPPMTNRSGILSGADILAHPGYITKEEARLAARRGVLLEITTRKGHNKTNRHVARMAKAAKAKMVLNSDTHEPYNLITKETLRATLRKAGLTQNDYRIMQKNARELLKKRKLL